MPPRTKSTNLSGISAKRQCSGSKRDTQAHINQPRPRDNCSVAVPGILGVITLTFFIIVC